MMPEHMTAAATEAIRIAETFFPNDFSRQRDLAREIAAAINSCEADLAQEIIRRVQGKAALR
jgi:hypothetical protein